jgi:tetratricopeptide (TPR) repeat protein
MALANTAWILAANGKRVLIADWDLESPGLHRFFQPFMDPNISLMPGVVDFIRRYEWAAREEEDRIADLRLAGAAEKQALQAAMDRLIDEHVDRVSTYAVPVNWRNFPEGGAIDFLTPGRQDNGVYAQALGALDWENLYDHLGGAFFFDALRAKLKDTYDYVLIDSRTGLSDIADICTLHLPDMVVDCFTLSTQGIEGAAKIARQIPLSSERDITIYPVPMRIDPTQNDNVIAGLQMAAELFDGLPAGLAPRDRERYWGDIKVPYLPSYAYEETLAAFGDRPGDVNSLLPAYLRIAALITNDTVDSLPPLEEWLRLRTRLQFSRAAARQPLPEVFLQFSPQDQLWAEWIAAVLAGAGVYARLAPEGTAAPAPSPDTRVIALASEFYFADLDMREVPPDLRPELLVCVTDVRIPSGGTFDETPVIFLADLPEEQAVDLLVERVGGRRPAEYQPAAGTLRYPGGGWDQVSNVPARNVNFTGRDAVLLRIREQLRSRPLSRNRPLTVQGVGGVGKTQVALEYAQRFAADYDVVWWINCAQSQYIDSSLNDLGTELRVTFNVSLPPEGTEAAPQVLEHLSSDSELRWLLVYDNVEVEDEENETFTRLLPQRGGHVLITSRQDPLAGQGPTMPLSVFQRGESVEHLRRRLTGIPESEAYQLAGILGDVPLAVATAGALLASESISVPEYLRLLDEQPARPGRPTGDFPEAVTKAWHLSLDKLGAKSPAAARLLGLCSVMAPVSSFDLVVSDAMVDAVQDLDPSITDRTMINLLIQQIDQLALIKVDHSARQMQVHQVVQQVVRQRMQDAKDLESVRQEVHQILVSARPRGDVDNPAMWPDYRAIWPHLTPSQAHRSDRPPVRDLLVDRVRYLGQRNDLARGVRRAEEIQKAWVEMLSDQQRDAAGNKVLRQQLYRLQFNLANILRALGRYEQSRALDEQVLAGQQELLGEAHQHTLQTRNSLAADLRALGQYQEALEYDLATGKLWAEKSGFGEDYPLRLTAAHNLALSYLLNGDSRQAVRLDLQTLDRRTRVYANNRSHPRTLESKAALCRDQLEAGRYEESVRYAHEVLTQAREAFGNDERITLNAYLWLGVAQRCAGDAQQAEANVDTAVSGLTRVFGPDSRDTLAGRLSRALNHAALGRVKAGREAAEEVLAIYQSRLGPNHPHSLICQLNLTSFLCQEEQFESARPIALSASEGLQGGVGAGHPYTLAAKLVLGSVYAWTGDPTEAERLEREVELERVNVLGPQHPDTLRCQANLLLTQIELGNAVSTTARRREVIQRLGAQIGANHPDVLAASEQRRLLCVIDPQPF